MKKRLLALLIVMLMLVSAFALVACGDPADDPCANGHVDADGNEKCDVCDADVPKTDNPEPELPEEPERPPTYKIEFFYHGISSEFEMDIDEDKVVSVVKDTAGNPKRVVKIEDNILYTLDILQNTAPTAEQVAEILEKDFTYSGINIVAWYDSPEKTNKVNLEELLAKVATEDIKLYAELHTEVPDKKGNNYCGEDVTWKIKTVRNETILSLAGKGPMYDFSYPEMAPWYYDEEGNRRTITQVKFEGNITSIGSFAFYNCSIVDAKNIEIPDSVKTIGAHAFAYSRLLKSAPLTDNIEVIGRSAFEGCESFTSIVIPNSVKSIGGYAFFDCLGYKNLVLGAALEEIGEFAFHHHSKKTNSHTYTYYCGTEEAYSKIVIGIGTDKFYSYGAYLYFLPEEGVDPTKVAGPYWKYNKDGDPEFCSYTIRYKTADKKFPLLTDYVLIGADGKGAYTQEHVARYEEITYRGYKFATWGNDKYLNGTPITKHETFTGARGLQAGDKITYEVTDSNKTLVLKGTGSTWDFEGAGDAQYGYLITTVGQQKIQSCMDTITSVVFEPGITRLGANSLAGFKKMVFIVIPATVTEVDPSAFAACANLSAIYYEGNTLCKGLDSLVDTKAKAYAKAPEGSTGNGAFWKDTASGERLAWSFIDGVLTIGGENVMPNFELEGGVTKAPWAIYEDVKEIKFAPNITTIGANAFAGMKKIDKITLNETLVNVPRSAFENSGYWNKAENWVDGALMSDKHLLAFDVSKKTSTGDYITIPQATKYIMQDAFINCTDVTKLVLPKYIDYIDPTAFAGLAKLDIIYYYGENQNAWNTLSNVPTNAKVLFRATKEPTENKENYWHMVSRIPTPWA